MTCAPATCAPAKEGDGPQTGTRPITPAPKEDEADKKKDDVIDVEAPETTPPGGEKTPAPPAEEAAPPAEEAAPPAEEAAPLPRAPVADPEASLKKDARGFRVWTDITGKHSVHAQFVSLLNGGIVRLQKSNGRDCRIQLNKLSLIDQRNVLGHRESIAMVR